MTYIYIYRGRSDLDGCPSTAKRTEQNNRVLEGKENPKVGAGSKRGVEHKEIPKQSKREHLFEEEEILSAKTKRTLIDKLEAKYARIDRRQTRVIMNIWKHIAAHGNTALERKAAVEKYYE